MSTDVVFSGPMLGRFFRLKRQLGLGTSLVSAAIPHAYRLGDGEGLPFIRRFCRGLLPHDGDIAEDGLPLSYDDDGTGVWRVWLREEERDASRNAVEELAARMALQEDPDTSLLRLQRAEARELLERAKRVLLKTAVPKIRIVPVVVHDDWVWIGRRSSSEDRSYTYFLAHLLGDIELDALLWPREGGWASFSYAALLAFCEAKGGQISSDVILSEVDIKGRSIHVKTADSADEIRSILGQLTRSSAETTVRRLSFDVYRDGVPIRLDVDSFGAFRAVPMRSLGGLPHDRIVRRFSDVRSAIGRLRDLGSSLIEKLEQEKEGLE